MGRLSCMLTLLFAAACSPSAPPGPVRTPSDAVNAPRADSPPASVGGFTFTGPYTHENLVVFLIEQPGVPKDSAAYLTLEEALKSKTLLVTEKSDGAQVNTLEIENTGDRPVYIQAGDTVKGGKQDRTIGVDMVLPPRSGKKEIDAFCVEPGRWSRRESDVQIATAAVAFVPAPAPLATKEQKLAVKLEKSQDKVWEEGRKANAKLLVADSAGGGGSLSQSGASYVLTTEDPAVAKKTLEYTEAFGRILEGKEDVVGFAFAVSGAPSTLEIYSGPKLFEKLWPKLLKGAALEAISKKTDKTPAKQVTAEDLKALLAQASEGKTSRRELSADVVMETIEGTRAATFDTQVKGEFLHRQILLK